MKKWAHVFFVLFFMLWPSLANSADPGKIKIFIVSSYHREYLWSQDTNAGVCAALTEFGFLESKARAEALTRNDLVETDQAVIKKAWMDTKRKNTKGEIAEATARITKEIQEFKPDLILLGDDNAANYIGNQFVDTGIPVVFWGVGMNPVKYGLIASLEVPGHNVTGVYQPGYLKESLGCLKELVPGISTFAVLSDDSETGRAKAKAIESLALRGELPLKLKSLVITDSFSEWQAEALALREQVDAFFVCNHNTLRDEKGEVVDPLKAFAWYLKNVKKPDCSNEKQFVQEGTLIAADDSGFKQGYEAVKIAYQILFEKRDPARIPVVIPYRGAIIVNRQRAGMLGIDLSNKSFVEEYIDRSLALEKYPSPQ